MAFIPIREGVANRSARKFGPLSLRSRVYGRLDEKDEEQSGCFATATMRFVGLGDDRDKHLTLGLTFLRWPSLPTHVSRTQVKIFANATDLYGSITEKNQILCPW
jgi:hypothetical protein